MSNDKIQIPNLTFELWHLGLFLSPTLPLPIALLKEKQAYLS